MRKRVLATVDDAANALGREGPAAASGQAREIGGQEFEEWRHRTVALAAVAMTAGAVTLEELRTG
jgi:hypothetical protein